MSYYSIKGHIIIVYDPIYPFCKGGGEKRLYEVAKGLVERGWKVTWYGHNWWGDQKTIHLDGINVVGVGKPSASRQADQHRRGMKGAILFSLALLKEKFPDDAHAILVGQTPWIHYFSVRLMLRGKNIPIVVDCWEVWREHWKDYYGATLGYIGMAVEKWVLNTADKIVSISNMTREMVESVGVSSNKIVLAHNGVSLNEIKLVAPSDNVSDVIYFGRLVAHKNVDVLIRAVSVIIKSVPNVRVFILGAGPELDNLKNLSIKLGLTKNVFFYGAIDLHNEAMSMLKASKVFVQPSTSEGGGSIAIMEAYACGLPVISFVHPQGIDPQLIKHNKTGLWVDEFSSKSLSVAIISLLNSTDDGMKLEINSLISKYDWSFIVSKYDDLFSSYLNP